MRARWNAPWLLAATLLGGAALATAACTAVTESAGDLDLGGTDAHADGGPGASDGSPAFTQGFDVALPDIPDGALWINEGDCGTGQVGATFMQVPAYCQPPEAVSSGYYQCDELANRFMRDALQHPDLDNVVTEYASSICGKAAASSAYSAGARVTAPPPARRRSPATSSSTPALPGTSP
jgi:hypothetical protein